MGISDGVTNGLSDHQQHRRFCEVHRLGGHDLFDFRAEAERVALEHETTAALRGQVAVDIERHVAELRLLDHRQFAPDFEHLASVRLGAGEVDGLRHRRRTVGLGPAKRRSVLVPDVQRAGSRPGRVLVLLDGQQHGPLAVPQPKGDGLVVLADDEACLPAPSWELDREHGPLAAVVVRPLARRTRLGASDDAASKAADVTGERQRILAMTVNRQPEPPASLLDASSLSGEEVEATGGDEGICHGKISVKGGGAHRAWHSFGASFPVLN